MESKLKKLLEELATELIVASNGGSWTDVNRLMSELFEFERERREWHELASYISVSIPKEMLPPLEAWYESYGYKTYKVDTGRYCVLDRNKD